MRKIAIIVDSKSDLKQCFEGLNYLVRRVEQLSVMVYVRSQHRNTLDLQELIHKLPDIADVAIVGASRANHLTAGVDAFLRYEVKTEQVPIIGVAFDDPKNDKHTHAAILSMTEVPGTQVSFFDENGDCLVGSIGFLKACVLATSKNLPTIKVPEPRPPIDLTLKEAIAIASE